MMLKFPGYSSKILPRVLTLPKLLQSRSPNHRERQRRRKKRNTGSCSPTQNRYQVWCSPSDSTNWSCWWLCHLLLHFQVLRVTHLIQPTRWRRHWSSSCCCKSKQGFPKRSMAQPPLWYIPQISSFLCDSCEPSTLGMWELVAQTRSPSTTWSLPPPQHKTNTPHFYNASSRRPHQIWQDAKNVLWHPMYHKYDCGETARLPW